MIAQTYGQVFPVFFLQCLRVIQKVRLGGGGVDGYMPVLRQAVMKNVGGNAKSSVQ